MSLPAGPACAPVIAPGQSAGRFLVGADLIRRRVAERNALFRGVSAPANGIVDWGLPGSCLRRANPRCTSRQADSHGMGVAAIMISPSEGSVFPARITTYDAEADVRPTHPQNTTNTDLIARERQAIREGVIRTPRALNLMRENDARVVNYSGLMLFKGYSAEARTVNDGILERIREFTADQKRVLVVSAGNEIMGLNELTEDMRAGRLRESDRGVRDIGGIVVGAVNPSDGQLTNRLNLAHVTVFAPTDNSGALSPSLRTRPLGETSGAAPLVSATLSDVLAVAPGLTRDQITAMLDKTALPMSHDGRARAGYFNAYKMFRVAERLKERCATQAADCIRRQLANEDLYDFSEEARRLEDLAQFEGCPSREVFDAARAAYLLNPVSANRERVDRVLSRTRIGTYPGGGATAATSPEATPSVAR